MCACSRSGAPQRFGPLQPLVDAADRAFDHLQEMLDATPIRIEIEDSGDAASRGIDALGGGQDVAGRGLSAATTAVHALTGLLLSVVALLFHLEDGPGLWAAAQERVPRGTAVTGSTWRSRSGGRSVRTCAGDSSSPWSTQCSSVSVSYCSTSDSPCRSR